uniref:PDZ domain-containing protein n=1 Tax=Astyanax mexicanus TaxID=7994 RepID=A0A3B1IFU1_ASTMX
MNSVCLFLRVTVIRKDGECLGISVIGGLFLMRCRNDTGIFVSEVRRGGMVEGDGRLLLGDQILSVNGEDIRAVSQDYANTLLQVRSPREHYRLCFLFPIPSVVMLAGTGICWLMYDATLVTVEKEAERDLSGPAG